MIAATCTECRLLLGGYVLEALEPEEAEAVRRHLGACDLCAAEHGELMGVPALLDVAGGVETHVEQPPAALEEAVLDRFAREAPKGMPSPRGPRLHRRFARAVRAGLARPIPAALAGAAAAAAVAIALVVVPGEGDTAEGNTYRASLAGTPAIPGATAKAKLRVLSSGTRVTLSVRGLRGQPDSVYELWCVRDDGTKVSAGTFRTDSAGRADVSLTTAAVPGEYHKLSVERKAFAPGTQPGERVMAGSIEYPRW